MIDLGNDATGFWEPLQPGYRVIKTPGDDVGIPGRCLRDVRVNPRDIVDCLGRPNDSRSTRH